MWNKKNPGVFVTYRQISNVGHTKFQNLNVFSSRPAVVFTQYIEARC